MPQFSVLLTRDITESCQVLVHASNADQAQEHALEILPTLVDPVWTVDDGSIGTSPAYVTACDRLPDPSEYAFDVKLFATIRVRASSEAEARRMLNEHLICADANFGAWPDGSPILAEASVDDDHPDLIEINGEAV